MTEKELEKIIENSKGLLSLKANWDDEWAIPIKKEIWNLAIKTLREIYKDDILKKFTEPCISPTINWGIDISWITDDYSILIWIFEDEDISYSILTFEGKDIIKELWWEYTKESIIRDFKLVN
jgi:hypothetical protein